MFLRLFKLILTSAGNTRKYVLKGTNLPLMSYKEIVSKQSNKVLTTNHIRNMVPNACFWRENTQTFNVCRIKTRSSAIAKSTARPSCLGGVLSHVYRALESRYTDSL